MKKILLTFLLFFSFANIGLCDLSDEKINVYNLKKSNMYMLDLDSNVKNIEISDKNLVNVTPITTITSNGKQLFIEANNIGICDVLIETIKNSYKVRFITGKIFDEAKKELIQIDFPTNEFKEI